MYAIVVAAPLATAVFGELPPRQHRLKRIGVNTTARAASVAAAAAARANVAL